jgi:acyl-coenzyme A synthetase/AMP-(fatty) acid ligase
MRLRELASAGEPLNPEVIERVRAAWNITIRDGFGQTENVLLLGNFPGQSVKPGAVGRPSPGHDVVLLDSEGNESNDGEIAVKCSPKPCKIWLRRISKLDEDQQKIFHQLQLQLPERLEPIRIQKCSADSAIA